MAGTIAIPTCSVSPQGGGTISYVQGTSGPIPGYDGSYQNYVFTATPAQGWRFLRFEISGTWSNSGAGTYNYTASRGVNPWTTEMDGSNFVLDGAAWWWSYAYGTQTVNEQVDTINVVAVFAQGEEGPYLIYDDSSGQLVYDDANTGRLVYGGTLT